MNSTVNRAAFYDVVRLSQHVYPGVPIQYDDQLLLAQYALDFPYAEAVAFLFTLDDTLKVDGKTFKEAFHKLQQDRGMSYRCCQLAIERFPQSLQLWTISGASASAFRMLLNKYRGVVSLDTTDLFHAFFRVSSLLIINQAEVATWVIGNTAQQWNREQE
ncbi:hypothetical protein EGJ52_04135 [Pseudomonas luteola]|uniref:hypothetical protein n=1 Tax=Pseudomonas luteola TaxID=47886 RepID=UPI000F76C54F|nr:hypothetical protein [Pseudomonas luteola]RRW46560.1 hypothetical protein EGJ52_04135 [Pseudomonas luteola]